MVWYVRSTRYMGWLYGMTVGMEIVGRSERWMPTVWTIRPFPLHRSEIDLNISSIFDTYISKTNFVSSCSIFSDSWIFHLHLRRTIVQQYFSCWSMPINEKICFLVLYWYLFYQAGIVLRGSQVQGRGWEIKLITFGRLRDFQCYISNGKPSWCMAHTVFFGGGGGWGLTSGKQLCRSEI